MLSDTENFDKQLMKEKLQQRLLALMEAADYRPLNKSELARHLELPSSERSTLRLLLRELEAAGTILKARKGRFQLSSGDEKTVVGVYRKRTRDGELLPSRKGNAPERASSPPLRIPARYAGTALDGDRVQARVRPARDEDPHWLQHLPKAKQAELRARWEQSPPRPEGEIIKVLERRHRALVGTLQGNSQAAVFRADDPNLPQRVDLPDGLPQNAAAGDKALVRIDSWENVGSIPRGHVQRVLGPANQPGVDILTIIHQHGLPTEFPEEVLEEAASFPSEVMGDAIHAREDWREAEIITIDPFDAKDFDDAIAVTALPSGEWELAVHIADVAHYVRPGTALDTEARARGNSAYLVDRVIPMLPEALSNGLCSLKPEVDRLTFCAVLRFDAHGRRTAERFAKAVIRSCRRLTYEEAFERLQSTQAEGDPITELLHRAWGLASTLRRRRFRKGSLDLDFPETKVLLDEQGRPQSVRLISNDASHQLIEEFMLAANEAVAERILRSGSPSLYRIHEEPDPDKLLEFRELAIEYGYTVGDLTQREALQRFLKNLRGQPEEPVLRLALLKSLKRAVYHWESRGHYGLAKAHYTHFTSPIRRYTDLVVHRVLHKLVAPQPSPSEATPTAKRVQELAEHLSDTERTAAEAEMATQRYKLLEYFEGKWRAQPGTVYRALITEVKRMGLFVELSDFQTRALIRVQDLPGERRYRFEPHRMRFNGGKDAIYQVGDSLDVKLERVDRRRRFIDVRPVTPREPGPGDAAGRLQSLHSGRDT